MKFLVHAEVGNIDIELTDLLIRLNGLLLKLFANLFEQINISCILSDSFLVSTKLYAFSMGNFKI